MPAPHCRLELTANHRDRSNIRVLYLYVNIKMIRSARLLMVVGYTMNLVILYYERNEPYSSREPQYVYKHKLL